MDKKRTVHLKEGANGREGDAERNEAQREEGKDICMPETEVEGDAAG